MVGDTRSGILEAEAWAQSEVSKQAKSVPPMVGGGKTTYDLTRIRVLNQVDRFDVVCTIFKS